MRIHQGRLFGALIIGGGVGYLFFEKYGNLWMAIAAAVAIIVGDYLLLTLTERLKKK